MLKKKDKEFEKGGLFLDHSFKCSTDVKGKKKGVLFVRFTKGSFFERF